MRANTHATVGEACGSGSSVFMGGGRVGLRPEQVILRQLMNGATDGSFVPVIELATALWEEE